MDEFLTTAEAARAAGVGVSSIKRWADRNLIRVIRTPGGHRRVDRKDLIRFLRESSGAGDGRRSLQESRTSQPSDLPRARPLDSSFHDEFDPEDQPQSYRAAYWADIMQDADLFSLQGFLLQARGRLGSWHAVADEAAEGLSELGRRWAQGDLTILEEHVASENLSRALTALMESMPRPTYAPECLLACPSWETHTLGLSFLQLCLREAGWRVLWVGSAPVSELNRVAASGELDMIALSASAASPEQKKLDEVAEQLGAACAQSGTRLVLGGRGAWPDQPACGTRLHSFGQFSSFLEGLA